LSQNFGEHKRRPENAERSSAAEKQNQKALILDDFDSGEAMETACQTQATTRKFAHQIMTAKATRAGVRTPKALCAKSNKHPPFSRKLLECDASSRSFDPSQRRQNKSGGRIPTAALKLSNLSEQEPTRICI
jgi:hypothetical protein